MKCLLLKVQTKYLLSIILNQTFFFPIKAPLRNVFGFLTRNKHTGIAFPAVHQHLSLQLYVALSCFH